MFGRCSGDIHVRKLKDGFFARCAHEMILVVVAAQHATLLEHLTLVTRQRLEQLPSQPLNPVLECLHESAVPSPLPGHNGDTLRAQLSVRG